MVIETYDYRDEQGKVLYQKERREPKDFRFRRQTEQGGVVYNLDDTRRVLYGLDKLQGRESAVLCEGEKDVDRLWALDLPATTTPDGAKRAAGKNWRAEYTDQLIEAGIERLVVIPDNDDVGRVYVRDAAVACHAAGIAVKVVELAELGPKGDVSDWLDAGHSRKELVGLLRTAPAYEVEVADAEQPARRRRTRSGPSWPAPLAASAFHGVFGDIVRSVEPHTEADPVALLVQALVAFGNIIGRSAYFMVGATRHHFNLYALIVGDTAKARKGTSQQEILRFFRALDSEWADTRVLPGLSSGEGLIWAVRDPIEKETRNNEGESTTEIVDEGAEDKRLLVVESEFASTLKVLKREGNTLSPVMRQAWDGGVLNTLTKKTPTTATNAHISIIGHITQHELRFGDTEAANGFGNRFLIACVRRSKLLPEGGCLDEKDIAPVLARLRAAVDYVIAREDELELRRDEDARRLWCSVYERLSSAQPGVLGTMTARAEAQVTRLSCLYALGDSSPIVRGTHLEAALALWRYCFESARFLFGDRTGDSLADRIRDRLRLAGPTGLTRTEMSSALRKNYPAERIDRALSLLSDYKAVRSEVEPPDRGRPIERWYATESDQPYEIDELSPDVDGAADISSSNSSNSDAANEAGWGKV